MKTPIDQQVSAVRWAFHELADADTHTLQGIHAAVKTLEFIQAHASGLRILVEHLRGKGSEPTEAERQALLAHPAVQDVIKAFPDAVMTVRDL